MSTKRTMTLKPTGPVNIFGALPWVLALRKPHGNYDPGRCEAWTLKGYPCKRDAAWLYQTLDGVLHPVCFSHIHRDLLGREDEQERLNKWMRQVRYWDLNGEFTDGGEER